MQTYWDMTSLVNLPSLMVLSNMVSEYLVAAVQGVIIILAMLAAYAAVSQGGGTMPGAPGQAAAGRPESPESC